MSLIIYLVAGPLVGYIASRIMHRNSQQDPLLDIVVGVVGTILAGYILSPLLGIRPINVASTIPILLASPVGAVILYWVYKMATRRV